MFKNSLAGLEVLLGHKNCQKQKSLGLTCYRGRFNLEVVHPRKSEIFFLLPHILLHHSLSYVFMFSGFLLSVALVSGKRVGYLCSRDEAKADKHGLNTNSRIS